MCFVRNILGPLGAGLRWRGRGIYFWSTSTFYHNQSFRWEIIISRDTSVHCSQEILSRSPCGRWICVPDRSHSMLIWKYNPSSAEKKQVFTSSFSRRTKTSEATRNRNAGAQVQVTQDWWTGNWPPVLNHQFVWDPIHACRPFTIVCFRLQNARMLGMTSCSKFMCVEYHFQPFNPKHHSHLHRIHLKKHVFGSHVPHLWRPNENMV